MVESIKGLGDKISAYFDGKTPGMVKTDVTSIAFACKLSSMTIFPQPIFSEARILKAEDSPFLTGLMKVGNAVFAGFCGTIGLPVLAGRALAAAIIDSRNSNALNDKLIEYNEVEITKLEIQINDLNEQIADLNINQKAEYLGELAEKKIALKNKFESYNELQHETEMLKKSGLSYLQEPKTLRGRINDIDREIGQLELMKGRIIDSPEESLEGPYGLGETPERRGEINEAGRRSNEGNARMRGEIAEKIQKLRNEKYRLQQQLAAKPFHLDRPRLEKLDACIREGKKTLITRQDNSGIYYEKVTKENVKEYLKNLIPIYEAKSARNEKFMCNYGRKKEDPNLLERLHNALKLHNTLNGTDEEKTKEHVVLVEYVLRDHLGMHKDSPK